MRIEKTSVRTYIERAYCEDCDSELKPTGMIFASNPPCYEHVCNCDDEYKGVKFKKKHTLSHRYPRQVVEENNAEENK